MTNTHAEKPSTKALYGRLLSHIKPYWKIFALAIVGMVFSALSEAGIPVLLKPLLDESFITKDAGAIQQTVIYLILLFIVRGIAGYVAQVGIAWVGHKVILDLRKKMFDKLIHVPQSYYDEQASGGLISRITFNANQVSSATTNALIVLVRDSVTILALLGWIFYLDWQLAMIFLIVGPVIGIIIKRISKRLRTVNHSAQNSMGELTHMLGEATNGNEVVKIFGGEEFEQKRFDNIANWVRRYHMKSVMIAAANVPIVQFIGVLALAAVITIVTQQEEPMSVGTFVSFFGAMAMLFSPIKRLTKVNEQLQKGLAAAESIFDLLDEEPEKDTGTITLERAAGRIEFKDLSFRYPHATEDALQGINLEIKPGETIALVGQSGSGKSTLASILPRFHLPSDGQILLDGHPLNDIKLKSLRDNIALVSQKVVLFNDSISANIAYGCNNKATQEQIVEAARAAHALEFIEKLPDGFKSMVGENGSRLSGGQRQRIAIARALLKDAPILIMDEATSALDTQSERHVQAALETLRQNRTAIIIAHRLSTIENADRIVVMNKGKIVEVGSHEVLIAKKGAYAKLYQVQFSETG